MIKKNILVLASTFPRWKNDTTPPFVFDLEKRLTKEFNIVALAPHFEGAKKNEKLEEITIYRFQYFWPASFETLCYEGGILPHIKKNKFLIFEGFTLLFFELLSAIKIIKTKRIDMIHAHWIIPQGIIALMLKKLLDIPYIVTTHGGDIYGLQHGVFRVLKKIILEHANKITVVSSDIKNKIQKDMSKTLQISVISMGVDTTLFNPDKYDKALRNEYSATGPLLLFVGRLAEKKGLIYLLRAMPKVLKQIPSTKLLIIGEGPLENQLKAEAKYFGIEQQVFFLGPKPHAELAKFYATADIFVGPSIMVKEGDTEGLGLTFAEASVSGCIPIGTTAGGIRDVIKQGITGYIVPQKDEESLAKTIIQILKDPAALKIKKNGPIQTQKKFDWTIVAEKYKQVYQ